MSPEGAPALLVLILGAGQTAAALVQGVEPRVTAHGRLGTLYKGKSVYKGQHTRVTMIAMQWVQVFSPQLRFE